MLTGASIIGTQLFIFWFLKPTFLQKYRIHQPSFVKPIFKTELKRSILGLSLYLVPTSIVFLTFRYFSYSPMYTDINEHGISYLVFTFILLLILVDTWFYWAHRLMHSHPFFSKAHLVHHESMNLNPLSAYSVDIVHGTLNIVPYAFVILFVPWHPIVIFSFGLFSIFYNGYIHLGYDLPQKLFQKNLALRLVYTARHHATHHQEFNYNYAAYFTFWDKLMKTEKITN